MRLIKTALGTGDSRADSWRKPKGFQPRESAGRRETATPSVGFLERREPGRPCSALAHRPRGQLSPGGRDGLEPLHPPSTAPNPQPKALLYFRLITHRIAELNIGSKAMFKRKKKKCLPKAGHVIVTLPVINVGKIRGLCQKL